MPRQLTQIGPKQAYRRSTRKKGNDEYVETALVMIAKYNGYCGVCKGRFLAGDEIIFNKISRNTYHRSC